MDANCHCQTGCQTDFCVVLLFISILYRYGSTYRTVTVVGGGFSNLNPVVVGIFPNLNPVVVGIFPNLNSRGGGCIHNTNFNMGVGGYN